MAQFTTDVPAEFVDDLSIALSRVMRVPPPVTPAEKITLAQSFTKAKLREALLDYRAQKASDLSRTNDPAATW